MKNGIKTVLVVLCALLLFTGCSCAINDNKPDEAVETFFEKYRAAKGDIMYKGAMFTFVYSIVVYTLNILKVIEGPYPFLKVYEQPITQTVVTILGMGVVLVILTFALYEIKKKIKI